MAFTIVTSWDFRGAETSSTKRTSRIGSYTLSEVGTPTYDASGVTCSDVNYLRLTLPTELKLTGDYWMMSNLRRLDSLSYNTIFGYNYSDPNADPFNSGAYVYAGAGLGAATNATGTSRIAAQSYLVAQNVDVNTTVTFNTSDIKFFQNSTEEASIATGSNPTYTSTSWLQIASPFRFAWILIGTGVITTGEMSTIASDPDSYIYPEASGGTSFLGINTGFIF